MLVKDCCNKKYLELQLVPATHQDSGSFIFEQDCHNTQDMRFRTLTFHGVSVATCLR